MVQFVLWLLLSIPLVWFSWKFLNDPKTYGFYRFFAFESILALVLLNGNSWFVDPWAPRQIFSWLLLLASLFLVLHGFHLLRRIGQPQGKVENTTRLVQMGAYKYIRHPLYSSLLWLGWGAFLKHISPLSLLLALICTAAVMLTAHHEEQECLRKFGRAYQEYMRKTKRFIPFVF